MKWMIVMLGLMATPAMACGYDCGGSDVRNLYYNGDHDHAKWVIGGALLGFGIACLATKCWKSDKPVTDPNPLQVTPDNLNDTNVIIRER